MEANEPLVVVFQTALTSLNLALTAWVFRATSKTQEEVKVNTKVTTEARDTATEVKEQANGALADAIERLEVAIDALVMATTGKPVRKKPAKKPAQKKPRTR